MSNALAGGLVFICWTAIAIVLGVIIGRAIHRGERADRAAGEDNSGAPEGAWRR